MDEYIEREALMVALCKEIVGDGDYYNGKDDMQDQIRDMVSRFPSADVAPVRHGRWVQVIVHVEVNDGFVDRVNECCSACHEPNGRRCTYFCPNCGAKMDLEG